MNLHHLNSYGISLTKVVDNCHHPSLLWLTAYGYGLYCFILHSIGSTLKKKNPHFWHSWALDRAEQIPVLTLLSCLCCSQCQVSVILTQAPRVSLIVVESRCQVILPAVPQKTTGDSDQWTLPGLFQGSSEGRLQSWMWRALMESQGGRAKQRLGSLYAGWALQHTSSFLWPSSLSSFYRLCLMC